SSESGTHAEHAAVAMDAEGDAIVVWDDTGSGGSSGTPGAGRVFAATKPAVGSWGSPVEVSAAARGGRDPGVGMDSRGDVVIAYSSQADSGARAVETVFGQAG